jgi:hypothetical protein
MTPPPYKKFRTPRRRARAIGASLGACAVIALVILLLPYGSPAPKAHAEFTMRQELAPIGPPPGVGNAARYAVAELLGQGGASPAAWNPTTGLWGGHTKSNWWQSGLALLALVRWAEATHDHNPAIQHVILRIYALNHYKPYAAARFMFANEFGDDTAWWGQAWLEASRYELNILHDVADAATFLAVAEYDANYIWNMPRTCGGIPWALHRPADAVTSAEFITLTAGLASYRERPGNFHDPARAAVWIAYARHTLRWLVHMRLVDLRWGWVVDQLGGHCQRQGGAMTYTEGEMADALVRLGTALHQRYYYREARNFLWYTLWPGSRLTTSGVLREHCELAAGACGHLHFHLDLGAYKGIFVNAVADYMAATHTHAYVNFLRRQAWAVLTQAALASRHGEKPCGTVAGCQFGFHWIPVVDADPNTLGGSVGAQESAIDALTVVLAR